MAKNAQTVGFEPVPAVEGENYQFKTGKNGKPYNIAEVNIGSPKTGPEKVAAFCEYDKEANTIKLQVDKEGNVNYLAKNDEGKTVKQSMSKDDFQSSMDMAKDQMTKISFPQEDVKTGTSPSGKSTYKYVETPIAEDGKTTNVRVPVTKDKETGEFNAKTSKSGEVSYYTTGEDGKDVKSTMGASEFNAKNKTGKDLSTEFERYAGDDVQWQNGANGRKQPMVKLDDKTRVYGADYNKDDKSVTVEVHKDGTVNGIQTGKDGKDHPITLRASDVADRLEAKKELQTELPVFDKDDPRVIKTSDKQADKETKEFTPKIEMPYNDTSIKVYADYDKDKGTYTPHIQKDGSVGGFIKDEKGEETYTKMKASSLKAGYEAGGGKIPPEAPEAPVAESSAKKLEKAAAAAPKAPEAPAKTGEIEIGD